MKVMNTSLKLMMALGLTAGSVAFAETTPKEIAEKVQAKVYELLDKNISTITFTEGSSNLSDTEQSSLKALVTAAKANGIVDKFVVASWSDQEYPTGKDAKLSSKQRDLADKRNDAIKRVLKAADANDVDTFTMAERPTWIGKTFNTEDAQIKGAGKANDMEEAQVTSIGRRLRDKGGPGKSVVVVKYKPNTAAH